MNRNSEEAIELPRLYVEGLDLSCRSLKYVRFSRDDRLSSKVFLGLLLLALAMPFLFLEEHFGIHKGMFGSISAIMGGSFLQMSRPSLKTYLAHIESAFFVFMPTFLIELAVVRYSPIRIHGVLYDISVWLLQLFVVAFYAVVLRSNTNNIFDMFRFFKCRFDSADLAHSVWSSSMFRDTTFAAANLAYAKFIRGTLGNCDFTSVNFANGSAVSATLHQCQFTSTHCGRANFMYSTLYECSFNNANLCGAKFGHSKLNAVTFDGANLSGANFTKATFNNVLFDGAVADSLTKWPRGFEPRIHNVLIKDAEMRTAASR